MFAGGLVSCKKENKLPKGINNPSSEYVVECLKKIPLITEIEAVTERNDPNGNLNKQGGYTAQVFFSYALVDQTEFDEETVIDKGTDCGGSIEVYRTEKDAKKRDKYLSTFDGGTLASGSHTVVGTVIVRTSCKLTATQQRSLEYDIIAALKGEDEKINTVNPYEEDFAVVKRSAGPNLTPQAVIDYCEKKDYSKAEIDYILGYCDIDWGTQAAARIEAYANASNGLRKVVVRAIMTEDEGWNEDDYEYGLAHCNVDWGKEALEFIRDMYKDSTSFSPETLHSSLNSDTGYSSEEVAYAIENYGVNWYRWAVVDAENIAMYSGNITKENIKHILEGSTYMYTEEQASYGANYYSNEAVWFLCYWEYCNGVFASEAEARQLLKNYKYSSKDIDTAIGIFYMHN